MSSISDDLRDPSVTVADEAKLEVTREPVVWPMIWAWVVWFFKGMWTVCKDISHVWSPSDEAHANARTADMATYVYVAGWTTLLAALLIKFAPGASLWTLIIIGFGQIILATALAYAVGRNRDEINDGDPG